jgi:hypothetical protein
MMFSRSTPRIEQHRRHRVVHHRRAAEIVLDVLGRGMMVEIELLQGLLADEADGPGPVVLGLGSDSTRCQVKLGCSAAIWSNSST